MTNLIFPLLSFIFNFVNILDTRSSFKKEDWQNKSNKQVTSSNTKLSQIRSSHPKLFLEKCVLKICSKFIAKHPCRSEISIKLKSNVIEIVLRHGCSPVNLLAAYFQNTFSQEHLWMAGSVKCNTALLHEKTNISQRLK